MLLATSKAIRWYYHRPTQRVILNLIQDLRTTADEILFRVQIRREVHHLRIRF